MLYPSRRFSFEEKMAMVNDYEDDIIDGTGEKLYNDLIAYRDNHELEQWLQKDLDYVIAKVDELAKDIKSRRDNERDETAKKEIEKDKVEAEKTDKKEELSTRNRIKSQAR